MGNQVDPGFGLVILETRLTPDLLTDKGAGTFDSAYTEAGPIPGHPEPDDATSRWRPQAIGAQSQDLTLLTLRGGFPIRFGGADGRSGASVAYRLATDSAVTDYRGWCEPNLITN